MKCELQDDVIRLCCHANGGVVNLNELLLLGLGCLLLEPRYEVSELGDLVEISYRAKDGEVYSHEFHKPYPQLAATQTSLFVLNAGSKFNIKQGAIIEPDDLSEQIA